MYNELVQLTRKTLSAAPVLREALSTLAPDLQGAWLYGSVAKETDTAQSDIDVMLVGENLSLATALPLLAPAEALLGRKVTPTCYTPTEFARRKAQEDSFVNRVLAQPTIPLLDTADEPARAG